MSWRIGPFRLHGLTGLFLTPFAFLLVMMVWMGKLLLLAVKAISSHRSGGARSRSIPATQVGPASSVEAPPRPDLPQSSLRSGWSKFRSRPIWLQVLAGLVALSIVSFVLSPLTDDAATRSQEPLSDPVNQTPSITPPSVSPEPATVEVPRVVGLSESSATRTLEQAGLTVEAASLFSDKKAGTVLEQSPSGGTLEPGSSVMLVVAKAYPKIPDVVGLKLSVARERMKNGGFEVKVRQQVSGKPAGTVISQTPSGGTGAKPGRTVTILIAKAPTSSGGGSSGGGSCDPSYPSVCIPPYPPDLDCGDVPYTNFAVSGSDPHGFDGDSDGIGCEA